MAAEVLASTVGMSREDWLAARRNGIGSSDAAAVLGLDEYRSPLAVYVDKKGLLPEEPENRFVAWGTRLEPVVASWFEAETGKKVRRRRAILRHSERPYVIADLDRTVVGEHAVLEIKTSSAWNRDEWGGDQIPLRVVVQVQHQLSVTGYPYGYVAVLLGGNDARWTRLDRDDTLIAAMLDRYERFWRDHVEAGVEPPVSAASDADLTEALYPQEHEDKTILLPSTAHDAIDYLLKARADRKAAEAAEAQAKAAVQALLGDAEAGLLPGFDKPVVTWRTVNKPEHIVSASSFRQLVVKERVLNGNPR